MTQASLLRVPASGDWFRSGQGQKGSGEEGLVCWGGGVGRMAPRMLVAILPLLGGPPEIGANTESRAPSTEKSGPDGMVKPMRLALPLGFPSWGQCTYTLAEVSLSGVSVTCNPNHPGSCI